ncbi:MAG: hypothetical protein Q4D57_03210 [Clostridia bacterium]|nr:hypothetical protein [Clostridia bacterium]
MAILKEITLPSGITVNYHRVVSVNNITNHASIIEIASYTSKSKRLEEKNALANEEEMNVFINTEYLSVPYNENLNVSAAYEYVKSTEKYAESEDDLI